MDIIALQKKMREAFRLEAADLLAELDSSMLELESHPSDGDLLNRVFRAIHTIKGSGATAGFKEMAAFTHHVEELFDEARMGRLPITPELVDLALRAKDLIGELMESENPAEMEAACSEVVNALARFLPQVNASSSSGSKKESAPAAQRHRQKIYFKPHPDVFFSGTDPVNLVDEVRTLGEATVEAKVDGVPPLDSLNPEHCYIAWQVDLVTVHPLGRIKEIFLFVEDESEVRIETETEPASGEGDGTGPLAAFLSIADQSLEAIGGFLAQFESGAGPESELSANYQRVLRSFQSAARHQNQGEAARLLDEQIQILEAAGSARAQLSSQDREKLATLGRQVEAVLRSLRAGDAPATEAPTGPDNQTVSTLQPATAATAEISKNASPHSPPASSTIRVEQEKLDRLMRAVGELLVARNTLPILAKKLSIEHGLSLVGKEVKDAGDHISHIAEDLQAAVMSIRMMPVRTVFQRFPRLVRDTCRAQGKEAKLVLEGEDTELDKTVIEQIGDPLIHLVRNALDHGIEPPEARELAGKPREGKIQLRAYNQGRNVVIEVQDDGRGMDPQRIKRKAVEKGLLTPADAEALTDRAALELIFLPGLSTAEKVTDISGRGVGMDVVRSNIQKLHGATALESQPGRGAKVTITLPTSLMVSKGLLVESNGEEYVFPIESVSEMVRLPRRQIHRHEQQYFASVRSEVFSVLRLSDHFASEGQPREIEWPEEVPLAIVQTDETRVGIAVDRFVRDVEVIVKPMGRELNDIRAFRGAAIMGDGRVVLVVNPSDFA